MGLATVIDLNERETAFVGALAAGQRPTRAARSAGYSAAHARNLLARPNVRGALRAFAANAVAVLAELEGRE